MTRFRLPTLCKTTNISKYDWKLKHKSYKQIISGIVEVSVRELGKTKDEVRETDVSGSMGKAPSQGAKVKPPEDKKWHWQETTVGYLSILHNFSCRLNRLSHNFIIYKGPSWSPDDYVESFLGGSAFQKRESILQIWPIRALVKVKGRQIGAISLFPRSYVPWITLLSALLSH